MPGRGSFDDVNAAVQREIERVSNSTMPDWAKEIAALAAKDIAVAAIAADYSVSLKEYGSQDS